MVVKLNEPHSRQFIACCLVGNQDLKICISYTPTIFGFLSLFL